MGKPRTLIIEPELWNEFKSISKEKAKTISNHIEDLMSKEISDHKGIKKTPDGNKVQISLDLDNDTYFILKEEADNQNKDISEFIEELVFSYLKAKKQWEREQREKAKWS